MSSIQTRIFQNKSYINRGANKEKNGEKIVLKNFGECNVLSEHNSKVLVSKDGVVWFVENPTKKRQEDEYSYDSVICNGFTFNDVFKDVEPMYINILETLTKQYRIAEESAKMIVDAVINELN